jgi:hypothetical protein
MYKPVLYDNFISRSKNHTLIRKFNGSVLALGNINYLGVGYNDIKKYKVDSNSEVTQPILVPGL